MDQNAPLSSDDESRLDPSTVKGSKGYFRVGREKTGCWWFIDSQNNRFFYKGVCAINRAGTARGRFAAPGPYHATIGKLYGEDPSRFADACFEKLRDMGFNALGAWCTEEFFDRGMPYTECLECSKDFAPYPEVVPSNLLKGPGVMVPDIFSPSWVESIDRLADRFCTPLRNSRDLVGYFTDNELGWGQAQTDFIWGATDQVNQNEGTPTLLQFCLSLEPGRSLREEAWRFVFERHQGSLDDVGKAWGFDLNRQEDLALSTENSKIVLSSEGYGEDHEAFSYHYARRYFSLTSEAIRRHDPNHLILGCRFGAPPGAQVLRACGSDVLDVISANNYRDNFYDRTDEYAEPTGMPILNGEYSWSSPYFTEKPLPNESDPPSNDGQRISFWGPPSLRRAATHENLVGYTWYRWVSDHVAHVPRTYGLVNYDDVVNAFHAELLRDVNKDLEALHATDR